MELWCKHSAVRLWTALILGGVAALVILPLLVGTMGPKWMVVPGIVFLLVAYWITGAVFAAIGRHRIDRLIDEAAVWERAGMLREVRQVLAGALNTVDSFFFSPSSRQAPARKLLAQTARFQMAQAKTDLPSDDVVEAYLISFPHDRDVAVNWLNGVLAGKTVTRQTHAIVARIKNTHEDDKEILPMVAQFFLDERCCDLTALKTYRQLVDAGVSLPDDLVHHMADFFLSLSRSDTLALKVYLDRYERGDRNTALLQGIAACSMTICSGSVTRHLLSRVDSILEEIDLSERKRMAEAFSPALMKSEMVSSRKSRRIRRSVIGPTIRAVQVELRTFLSRCIAGFSQRADKIRKSIRSRRAKVIVKWAAMGLSIAGVALLVINTVMHLSSPPKTVETPPEQVIVLVADPFTIQVAAYLKESDARRYVDRLKNNGMDAYWTRASGGGKTWYQVRISHFETKAAAKVFGENLKMRGMVDDYYVANYNRPDS